MKVVIPMAGRGLRFAERGVPIPKPLIQVARRPMVYWALQSLADISLSEIIFITLLEHEERYGISRILESVVDCTPRIILLDAVTEGQLCTVMAARQYLDSDEDVLIASSDTYVVSNLIQDIAQRSADCHGIISVADIPGDRWSFARTGSDGRVVEVAEKKRISGHASTGLYYFTCGHELVAVADEIIYHQEKTRGEYYIIPVYQKFIHRGWRVDISIASQMWDMGTPEALIEFESFLEKGRMVAPRERQL